jgi:hypothetical protein
LTWPCALPELQFNDDGVWHTFATYKVALKAGPWLPCLEDGCHFMYRNGVQLNELPVDP